jgi:transcriptional regulator
VANKKIRYQNRIELLQGTLDLLVLQTLVWGPQHGYGISQAIRRKSSETLRVDRGSLYPALHRLEREQWIVAEWRISENGQRAKYYRLTPLGKKQLSSERSRWARLTEAIAGVLGPTSEESEG